MPEERGLESCRSEGSTFSHTMDKTGLKYTTFAVLMFTIFYIVFLISSRPKNKSKGN